MTAQHYLFDWGDTLMVDLPNQTGPMCDWPHVEQVPGAQDCLRHLSQNAVCHLATNARDSSINQIRSALARGGLSEYLDKIFCFNSIGLDKSAPAFYAHIVTSLHVNPAQLTMVGDSLSKDVYPALAQGLNAIWYNPQQLPCPEQVVSIHHLTELLV